MKSEALDLGRFLRYQASPFGMPSGYFKNGCFQVIFEKFFKKGFILHCKSLILNECIILR